MARQQVFTDDIGAFEIEVTDNPDAGVDLRLSRPHPCCCGGDRIAVGGQMTIAQVERLHAELGRRLDAWRAGL